MTSEYPIFLAANGQDPATSIEGIIRSIQPTIGDALYGGQIIRSEILQSTAQGVDANGTPFVGYSPGYAKQKLKKLGKNSPVDLFGPDQHVHMLNTILVKVGGFEVTIGDSPQDIGTPSDLFEVGFYGQESIRAKVHNEGASIRTRAGSGKSKGSGKSTATIPQRNFFAANAARLNLVAFGIGERMMARARTI
jgi:hypothetical protein